MRSMYGTLGYDASRGNSQAEHCVWIERLSLTFTANGKNKTFAVCLQLSVQ